MRLAILLATLLICLQGADTFYGIPKVLWTFWDSGFDSARLFTKMCINNMAHFSSMSGWQFHFLSNHNYTQFISEQSRNRLDMMYATSKHKIWKQNWADLMRLFLIYENGGMWVDTNSFFLGNFSWIENIAKQKLLENRLSAEPQIITFSLSSRMGGNKTKLYDEQLGSQVYLFPGVQIWSFISKPRSKFLGDVIDRLEYCLGTDRAVLDAEDQRDGILFDQEKDPYYITSNYIFQTVLQRKQRELEGLHNSSSRYAVQHYCMWNMPSQNTVYGVFISLHWFTFNAIEAVIKQPLSVLMQRYGFPAYFMKFNGENYPYMNLLLTQHQFAGCLGIDVRIEEGSVFQEFVVRPSKSLPEVKHMRELYESGYMKAGCEHLGSYVTSFYQRLERYFWIGVLMFVGLVAIGARAIRQRALEGKMM